MTPDAQEIDALAGLHCRMLPGSLVSRLGRSYARSFYAYVAISPQEILIRRRGGEGLAGAAVLSLEPWTLSRRLLRATPVATRALLALPRLLDDWLRSRRNRGRCQADDVPPPRLPELLLIFRDPGAPRGTGSGLLDEAEAVLRRLGMTRYCARTEDSPDNPAIRFYQAHGFAAGGRYSANAVRFLWFEKSL